MVFVVLLLTPVVRVCNHPPSHAKAVFLFVLFYSLDSTPPADRPTQSVEARPVLVSGPLKTGFAFVFLLCFRLSFSVSFSRFVFVYIRSSRCLLVQQIFEFRFAVCCFVSHCFLIQKQKSNLRSQLPLRVPSKRN